MATIRTGKFAESATSTFQDRDGSVVSGTIDRQRQAVIPTRHSMGVRPQREATVMEKILGY
jgi:hypothetical protein